jgi:alanine racemase
MNIASPHQSLIHHLVELQAAKTPDAVAIVFQDQHLTYQELNQKANQLAHHLQALGVEPDVLVGICVERSLDMFVALLGVLKAGGAYIPLDPNYPAERLAFILEDAEAPILITEQHLQSTMPETMPEHKATVLCIDQAWNAIAQHPDTDPQSTVQPENLAYVIYTSGSTGKPKGVQIMHGAAVNLLSSMQQEPGMNADDTLLAITTISFDLSVPDLYLPLITGAKIRLIARDIATDAHQLAQILSEPDVTFVQATPATWRLILAADWQGNPHLKILCGGEALTRALANQLLDKVASLWHMYGPTETTVWSMVHRVEQGDRPVPLGHAIANTQIYIVQENSRRKDDPIERVAPGEAGELYIGGDGVARGYLNRAELTSEKFIADPFSADPTARLYRTGDLARLMPDGSIEMIGRIDNQVKIRGYRIELGDIETTLSQHPDVREAAVIAIEDSPGNRRLVAYVVLRALAAAVRSAELRTWLKEKLPEYMVPGIVFFMDSLPLTPNRKVDRRALPLPTLESQEERVPPRTELERQLVRIWSEVLGIEIGIDQHFFESGGDSLRTALVIAKMRTVFQLELTLEYLFKAPTVASFAEIIEAMQSGSAIGFRTQPADLLADAVLDATIRPLAPSGTGAPATPDKRFFLTGATGFIGAFLIPELLQRHPQSIVYCLIRADDLEAAGRRLRRTLENYEIWQDAFGSRIIPILGDLAQPRFGLSEQQFRELADRIDIIYHSGAYVNLVYPYAALRNANVLGTQEALRLATQTRTLPVHYISTIDVFHTPQYQNQERIMESDPIDDCEGYTEGYSQSKWVAEKLVMAARDRGLPVCIYRLGMITGHSQTGGFQLGNLICRMIKGFIQLGCAPDLDLEMSLAPVDYTVKAIAHLSQQPNSIGQTFHVVSPHSLSLQHLIGDINQLGYEVSVIPYSEWQAKLLTLPSDNALTPAVSMFTQSASTPAPIESATFVAHTFDTRNTQAGLAGTPIICPSIHAVVLQTYVAYFVRQKFLPLPPRLTAKPLERAWVEINLDALAHNIRQVRNQLAPDTELVAIVKADAYGHGAVTVAQAALQQGAASLGVATIAEGIELRRSNIKAPILLLGASNTPSQVRTIADWQLQPTICSPKQALMFSTALSAAGYTEDLPVHICIDTGMSRLGTSWQTVHQLVKLVEHLPRLKIVSIYSHFATADNPDPQTMVLQNTRFQEAIAQIKTTLPLPSLHIANSAATLQGRHLHYDKVRVGLALYGLYPAPHFQNRIDLQPVLQVKARVTQVKTIPAGTGVSYGHQFVTQQETRVAVVGIGYADGVSRRLSNQIAVLIRGQRVPQIGAITMDQLMLDVSSIPDLQEGEIVTLIGQDGEERLAIEDWAEKLGTISWEILCGFKQRLPRLTKRHESAQRNVSAVVH